MAKALALLDILSNIGNKHDATTFVRTHGATCATTVTTCRSSPCHVVTAIYTIYPTKIQTNFRISNRVQTVKRVFAVVVPARCGMIWVHERTREHGTTHVPATTTNDGTGMMGEQ